MWKGNQLHQAHLKFLNFHKPADFSKIEGRILRAEKLYSGDNNQNLGSF